MKTNILYFPLLVLLSAVSLCGCSNDDEPVVTATDGTTLTVTARADGFASTDGTAQTSAPHTRASESGYATTFVTGDQIGVFAVKNGSVITGCRNVPCTYDGTAWNGTIYKYSGATYFAYYPYTESMNDKTSVDEIVTAFNATVTTATDQSTYAKYTACDLMTADAISPTSSSLSFSFTHKMSLIEISLPMQKYKTSGETNAYEYSAPVLGATFSLTPSSGSGTTKIKPYPMGNGVFRYIVPASTSGATVSGAFNIADGKTIEYSKSSLSLSAGNYKRLNVTYSGAPSTPTVRVLATGDFFYSDGGIVPGDTKSPPSEGCIGIVFWVGDATMKDKTLAADHSGCTHGLVVALNDASASTVWQDPYVSVQNWLNSNQSGVFLAVQSNTGTNDPLNNIQGYNNTKAIEAFNVGNPGYKVQAVEAVVAYRSSVSAPGNSSDWYLPSEKELTLLCGKEVSNIWSSNSGGTENRDLINGKLSSISGAVQISSATYWSSTEGDRSYVAFNVFFANGNVGGNGKGYTSCRLRCALAF